MAQNDGIYTGLRAFPAQNPVNCDGFGLCTLQSDHRTPYINTSVFSSSCLQEWPQTTLFAGFFFVAERVFSALGGFKVAQNDGTHTGSCGFLAQNPVNSDGFKLCTLQSGHKTPSTPPWRGSLSTATKHRQYQCFQLLQFARVASNHAMDRVFCGS